MNNFAVTIGIPAYNEADNIGNLLEDISHQELDNLVLSKVIVVNDASNDNTVKIVNKFNKKLPIKIIDHTVRQGKAVGINEIFSQASSDAIVILDADIRIKSKRFIIELTKPIFKENCDLTSADQKELAPTDDFSKVLFVSTQIKRDVFNHYRDGNNFYTCHGQARGFSKRLCKTLRLKSSIGEDLYSYVFCIVNGFKYRFVGNIFSIYKLPSTLIDHERQSIRFAQAMQIINSEFGSAEVRKLTHIPWLQIAVWTSYYLLRHPVSVTSNVIIYLESRLKSFFSDRPRNAWNVSSTSKKLSSI
jgi:glycosyltransferase involved in cell wall biosynthesis